MTSDLPTRAHALWRALTYLCVAQVHLDDNPLLARPLAPGDVTEHPGGHWGTVPGTAWLLTHVALASSGRAGAQVVPLIGAGHAGIVQRALAWLTGDLAAARPRFTRDVAGLTALVRAFPHLDGLGAEVHPGLPAGGYLGGWLGGALAFAQGTALRAEGRVVAVILGDGECETPTTAAAWPALPPGTPAPVLPLVHLNGERMGGPSLLGALDDDAVVARWAGLGWRAAVVHVSVGTPHEHATFHRELLDALRRVRRGERRVIFLRCTKGWSGPAPAHKSPLTDPRHDPGQRESLRGWLSGYRPHELFTPQARPHGALAEALGAVRLAGLPPPPTPAAPPAPRASSPVTTAPGDADTFAGEISAVLRAHARTGPFALFSPDELASNRLGALAGEPWVHELLAEEVLLGWLAGWTATGRRGLLVSYEAFAPLLLTGLVGQLKQRRLAGGTLPSLNLLLTSYGWQNSYTHADPSLVTALLATGDPAVHVFTPADPHRAARALDDALASDGRLNVVLAGKHTRGRRPTATLALECAAGLAVWPELSDDGPVDLALVCAGDLPAAVVRAAAPVVRARLRRRLRVVNVHDLTALAGPAGRRALGDADAVLVVTLGHPAAVWGLLAGRPACPTEVIGWREPPHPLPQHALADLAGLTVPGVTAAAARLTGTARRSPRRAAGPRADALVRGRRGGAR